MDRCFDYLIRGALITLFCVGTVAVNAPIEQQALAANPTPTATKTPTPTPTKTPPPTPTKTPTPTPTKPPPTPTPTPPPPECPAQSALKPTPTPTASATPRPTPTTCPAQASAASSCGANCALQAAPVAMAAAGAVAPPPPPPPSKTACYDACSGSKGQCINLSDQEITICKSYCQDLSNGSLGCIGTGPSVGGRINCSNFNTAVTKCGVSDSDSCQVACEYWCGSGAAFCQNL
jgi:hypothetical protein